MARTISSPSDRAPVLIAFGEAVRYFRKQMGFSQEAFAHHCGIDRSYMGGVERGERNLSLVNVAKILTALRVQPSEFFQRLDAPDSASPTSLGMKASCLNP